MPRIIVLRIFLSEHIIWLLDCQLCSINLGDNQRKQQGDAASGFALLLLFYDFAGLKLSFSFTDRLNTSCPGLLSLLSAQKYPCRMN